VPSKLEELALRSTDSRAFRQDVRPILQAYVPFDAYCVNTCDPVTRVVTSSVGDGLRAAEARRLFATERRGADVNLLADLGVNGPRVVTISETTGGAPQKSERMRTIFLPQGFADELRAALALGDHVWGYLHLFRKGRVFDAKDVSRIEAAAPILALGLALALARPTASPPSAKRAPFVPQLVEIDRRGAIVGASPAARRLLSAFDLDGHQPVPHGVYAAKRAADAGCFRAPSGDWLAFRRFDLGRRTAILLDRATPDEVKRTMMLAFGLTARERQVATLVVEGLTNAQLAGELRISLHTAKDHMKALLTKTGASTRSELARVLATGA
jgi:DNA-binding CsgD family transcriptional regulator